MNDNFLDDPLLRKYFFRQTKTCFYHTRGKPTYSSILKVTTYLNDNCLIFTNSINFLYVSKGVLPMRTHKLEIEIEK